MRRWFFLVLSIATIVLGVVAWRTRRGTDDETGPFIPRSERPEAVLVWFGDDGDLEIVVAPFYAAGERDAFNRRVFNENLELSVPLDYFRVLVVNHGETARALPEDGGGALRIPDMLDWRARDLRELLAEAGDRVPDSFRFVVDATSSAPRPSLGPRELVTYVVGVPPEPPLSAVETLRMEGLGSLELRRGRVSAQRLDRYRFTPRGRFAALLLYDGEELGGKDTEDK